MPQPSPAEDFAALVARYDPLVSRAIVRISHGAVRDDDLPDLKQSVWLRLLQTVHLYNPSRAAFSTFLYNVTRSVVVNAFVKNSRTPTNQAARLVVYPTDERGTVHASGVPRLRDDGFEDRMAASIALTRFAEAAAGDAELLGWLAAAYKVEPEPRKLARELHQPLSATEALHLRAVRLLRKLV